eukprot:c13919_g1_i3.p1 GENE.c13919_g1_i3~~c13919_g1_i3.p1  ORF type:complete len:298 (+),score=33.56 c13919_g1_i3:57-896(+)
MCGLNRSLVDWNGARETLDCNIVSPIISGLRAHVILQVQGAWDNPPHIVHELIIESENLGLEKRARSGEHMAEWVLGTAFHFGLGTRERDPVQARFWYERCILRGNALGQCMLGMLLFLGHSGVPRDRLRALSLYRASAAQGHAGAQNNIGCMYRDGEGVPRSDPEALMWFTLAASQGHVQGQNSLGHLIFLGHGTSQCDTLAVYWWTKSANQGNHVAQVMSRPFFPCSSLDCLKTHTSFFSLSRNQTTHFCLLSGISDEFGIHARIWTRSGAGRRQGN